MDVFENEIGHGDLLEELRFLLPEIKKMIDANGIERESNDECIREVYSHVRMMVADYKYTCIDFNDVTTILQSGENAVVAVAEGSGQNRAEKTATELMKRIEATGCNMKRIRFLLLHIQFADTEFPPTKQEACLIKDTLVPRMGNGDIVIGISDDADGEGDFWRITAIAIY